MKTTKYSWKKLKWGDLATLEYGKGLRGYQNTEGTYPVYGTNGQIGWHKEPLCHKHGIIIGRKGAYRGIHYSNKPFFVIDTAFYLNPITDSFDVKWAYYQLLDFDINSLDSGSAIPSTSRDAFYQIRVNLPPLSTQRKIASILSAYDDLIEKNTRRIKILEEMAQAIYKEWFVNFRFPGHEKVKMVESELGLIPKGWEVKKLGEIIEIQKGKKANNIFDLPKNNAIPYLLIDGLKNRSFLYTDDAKQVVANKNDIIMVMDGASSGQVFIGSYGFVGSTLATFRVKRDVILSQYLLFHFLRDNYKAISDNNVGSAIPHANKEFITSMKIIIPSSKINETFDVFARHIFNQIDTLGQKNTVLRHTRDLLLPKLISGEIDVEKLNMEDSINEEGVQRN